MKKSKAFLFLVFLLSCCHQQKNFSYSNSNEPWFLADSLYKFHNYTGKLTYKDTEPTMVPIDSNAIKILLSKMAGFSPGHWDYYYRVGYFSKQKKINHLQPILIYVGGDDYSSFLMIVLNENNKV